VCVYVHLSVGVNLCACYVFIYLLCTQCIVFIYLLRTQRIGKKIGNAEGASTRTRIDSSRGGKEASRKGTGAANSTHRLYL
jgi:hypothetical protein